MFCVMRKCKVEANILSSDLSLAKIDTVSHKKNPFFLRSGFLLSLFYRCFATKIWLFI